MVKRALWSTDEDKLLADVVDGYSGRVNWKEVSDRLFLKRIKKTSSQCKRRFVNKVEV